MFGIKLPTIVDMTKPNQTNEQFNYKSYVGPFNYVQTNG